MFLHFDIEKEGENTIAHKKKRLIDEQSSALHRIMWIYNPEEPQKRTFENNICAFHIGNGYFLSVAHNLRLQAGYVKSIDLETYRQEIYAKLDGSQNRAMEQYYFTDEYTRKKYLATADAGALNAIMAILKQKRFDTRWETLARKGICKPHLVMQFQDDKFYNNADLAVAFPEELKLYDAEARKHTFLLPVELVKAWYGADIALYRIIGVPPEVIAGIPSLPVNYDFMDDECGKLYCLQSSPSGPTGRLLNTAVIEGMLDHFGIFPDEIGGNYLFEGYRYLVKGYFRFGSSGAPYLYYDAERGDFIVNAIQSEASGIQLSIKNDREGNYQYVNAIASPLFIIKDELQRILQADNAQ